LPVHILHGAPRSGKTTALRALVRRARERGRSVGGFLALGRWRDGRREGFDLAPADGGAAVPLCRAEAPPDGPAIVELHGEGGPRVGKFHFLEEGLRAGREALERAAQAPPEVAVVDELGFLELAGGGWDPWVRPLLAAAPAVVVLVVRDELVDDVCRHYGLDAVVRHEVGDAGWPDAVLGAPGEDG